MILSKWKTTILIILCTIIGVSCSNKSKSDKRTNSKEWTKLFNGEDLSGWTQLEGKAKYTVKDGQIVGTTVPDTPNSVLATKKNYSDFLLELDVKVDTALNSGIQIRSHSKKDYKNGNVYGYQVEIDPSERAWSGGIYDSRRRGWLENLKEKPKARNAFNNNEWNHYRVKAIGDTIKTWVNNIPIVTLVDSVDENGFIGLQVHHSKVEEPLKVRYRDIRIKKLR